MKANRLVYGAWAVVLAGAIGFAALEVQTRTGRTAEKQPSPAAGDVGTAEPLPLEVRTASFQQDQPPGHLPVISDNDPLADAKLKALRRIVAEEMPGASEQEMDVWTEQFMDLPEETVRFLLRQKRTSDGVPPAAVPPPPESAIVGSPASETLVTAHEIQRCNLMNVATTGFRRRLIEFEGHFARSQPGVQIAEIRFDMSLGQMRQTGRSLDFAVNGPGFFHLTSEQGSRFTRCGRFRIGTDRHIVLVFGGRELPLASVDAVPEDTEEILVTPDGEVTARLPESTVSLGSIRVARFLDASRMNSDGGCLFEPTARSGPPRFPGASAIQQGWLEGSNARPDVEQRLLKQIEAWQELGHVTP